MKRLLVIVLILSLAAPLTSKASQDPFYDTFCDLASYTDFRAEVGPNGYLVMLPKVYTRCNSGVDAIVDFVMVYNTSLSTVEMRIYVEFPNGSEIYSVSMSLDTGSYSISVDPKSVYHDSEVSSYQYRMYGDVVESMKDALVFYQSGHIPEFTISIKSEDWEGPHDSSFTFNKKDFDKLQSLFYIYTDFINMTNGYVQDLSGVSDRTSESNNYKVADSIEVNSIGDIQVGMAANDSTSVGELFRDQFENRNYIVKDIGDGDLVAIPDQLGSGEDYTVSFWLFYQDTPPAIYPISTVFVPEDAELVWAIFNTEFSSYVIDTGRLERVLGGVAYSIDFDRNLYPVLEDTYEDAKKYHPFIPELTVTLLIEEQGRSYHWSYQFSEKEMRDIFTLVNVTEDLISATRGSVQSCGHSGDFQDVEYLNFSYAEYLHEGNMINCCPWADKHNK